MTNNTNTNNVTTTTAEFVIGFTKSIQNKIHGCEDCPHKNFWDCLVMHKECKCSEIKTWYENENNGERIPLPEFIVPAEEADKLDPPIERLADYTEIEELRENHGIKFNDFEIKRKPGLYKIQIRFYLDEEDNKIFYYIPIRYEEGRDGE